MKRVLKVLVGLLLLVTAGYLGLSIMQGGWIKSIGVGVYEQGQQPGAR